MRKISSRSFCAGVLAIAMVMTLLAGTVWASPLDGGKTPQKLKKGQQVITAHDYEVAPGPRGAPKWQGPPTVVTVGKYGATHRPKLVIETYDKYYAGSQRHGVDQVWHAYRPDGSEYTLKKRVLVKDRDIQPTP